VDMGQTIVMNRENAPSAAWPVPKLLWDFLLKLTQRQRTYACFTTDVNVMSPGFDASLHN